MSQHVSKIPPELAGELLSRRKSGSGNNAVGFWLFKTHHIFTTLEELADFFSQYPDAGPEPEDASFGAPPASESPRTLTRVDLLPIWDDLDRLGEDLAAVEPREGEDTATFRLRQIEVQLMINDRKRRLILDRTKLDLAAGEDPKTTNMTWRQYSYRSADAHVQAWMESPAVQDLYKRGVGMEPAFDGAGDTEGPAAAPTRE